jgi:hypothetical protein
MRYGLLTTVAVAALSLSVAAGVAQQSSGGTSSGGSAGGSAGGSSGQQMIPQSGGSGSGGAAGTSGSAGGSSSMQGGSTTQQGGATAGSSTGTSGTRQQPSGTASTGGTATSTGSTGITLNSEQRTQVSQAFRSIRAEPLRDVNFSVSVGSTVPASVTTLQTCPSEVVRLIQGLPECRYIVVRDQIVIVEPSSRRIVTVIERQG